MQTVIQKISSLVLAIKNAEKTNNSEWIKIHKEKLSKLTENYLPSGSGFDKGSKVLVEESDDRKINIIFDFHHMNDGGMYDTWTSHKMSIISTFDSFDMKCSGPNKNQCKDYFYDTFSDLLSENYKEKD